MVLLHQSACTILLVACPRSQGFGFYRGVSCYFAINFVPLFRPLLMVWSSSSRSNHSTISSLACYLLLKSPPAPGRASLASSKRLKPARLGRSRTATSHYHALFLFGALLTITTRLQTQKIRSSLALVQNPNISHSHRISTETIDHLA